MFYYKLGNQMLEFSTKNAYEPREDSKLLARTLEDYDLNNKKLLDMGTGSGIIAILSSKLGANVAACDIIEKVIETAKSNSKNNNEKIYFFQSNLFNKVKDNFDIITFNVPYLPHDPRKEPESFENESMQWAGGENLEILDRFCKQVKNHLNPNGKILLVLSSLSEDYEKILKNNDLDYKVIKKEKIPWEWLYVIEASL